MGNSVTIRTPIPSAEKVADTLGLSKARREFLSQLASTVKRRHFSQGDAATGMAEKAKQGRKREDDASERLEERL